MFIAKTVNYRLDAQNPTSFSPNDEINPLHEALSFHKSAKLLVSILFISGGKSVVGEKRRLKIADMADSTAILTFRNKQPSRSDKMNPTEKEKEHWANKLLHTSGIGIGHGTGRVYPR